MYVLDVNGAHSAHVGTFDGGHINCHIIKSCWSLSIVHKITTVSIKYNNRATIRINLMSTDIVNNIIISILILTRG